MTSLSKIIAGTMNWGAWDKKLSTAEMAQLMHVCVENGVTSFDHADIYGSYTTETEFGKAFSQSGIAREKVQFISKCGIQINGTRNNKVKHYDYSKAYLIDSVEQSLKNLQTDHLDVFLLHRPSPLMVTEEIAVAVTKLKSEGKIKSFGLSNFTPAQCDLIRKLSQVEFNQIQFSATHFEPMINGSLDYMQLHDIRPMAWNPLGIIFRENSEKTLRLKKLLAELLAKYGLGADLLLLAWVMQHPSGVIPVAGTVNVARIQQLKKLDGFTLEPQDWFAIWETSMGHEVP